MYYILTNEQKSELFWKETKVVVLRGASRGIRILNFIRYMKPPGKNLGEKSNKWGDENSRKSYLNMLCALALNGKRAYLMRRKNAWMFGNLDLNNVYASQSRWKRGKAHLKWVKGTFKYDSICCVTMETCNLHFKKEVFCEKHHWIHWLFIHNSSLYLHQKDSL